MNVKEQIPSERVKPKLTTNFSNRARYDMYNEWMVNYPKMRYDNISSFEKKVVRLEKYITKHKYWVNANCSGEKTSFIETFDIYAWTNISHSQRLHHEIKNCKACKVYGSVQADNHLLKRKHAGDTFDICRSVAMFANSSDTEPPPKKLYVKKTMAQEAAAHVVNILDAPFKKQFKVTMSEALKVKDTSSAESNNKPQIIAAIQTAEAKLQNDGKDALIHMASFTQSDRAYTKRRVHTYFEDRNKYSETVKLRQDRVNNGTLKPRKAIGNFDHYEFDKPAFLTHVRNAEAGDEINWSELARHFQLQTATGTIPSNGGQVLQEFAKSHGIDLSIFNKDRHVSIRDGPRIRVPKKKINITVGQKNIQVSIPSERPISQLNDDISALVESGDIDIGQPVAPKEVQYQQIVNSEVTTKSALIYGRQIPLKSIRTTELARQVKMGVIKDPGVMIKRHLRLWHDHSDIGNSAHMLFTIQTLYDDSIFLTDAEYKEKTGLDMSVQSFVEIPTIYILGQSSSSDVDMALYNECRQKDLLDLHHTVRYENYQAHDTLKFMVGDHPARTMEKGHQRGGGYSCPCGAQSSRHRDLSYTFRTASNESSLQDCAELLLAGNATQDKMAGSMAPLKNLGINDLKDELEARDYETGSLRKPELQEMLQDILHGTQKLPAILSNTNHTLKTMNCEKYEVVNLEPLHDIGQLIMNIIKELPYHVNCKETKAELEQFTEVSLGAKGQIKMSDARYHLIKLCLFVQEMARNGKVSENFSELLNCLAEITNIAYSYDDNRTPAQILRLYNTTFKIGVLLKEIVNSNVKSPGMTHRKFYGIYYHDVTVHAPDAYRIVCLRSLLAENDERVFGDLRTIANHCSCLQPGKLIGRCLTKYGARKLLDLQNMNMTTSFLKQDSTISRAAKQLQTRNDSIFTHEFIKENTVLWQAHCERIADFLLLGEGVWWVQTPNGILFFDKVKVPQNASGPPLHHFRSCTLQNEKLYLADCWKQLIHRVQQGELEVPLVKIKVHDDQGNYTRTIDMAGKKINYMYLYI